MSDLWTHQERGIASVQDAIEAGSRRNLLTCPTGGGKSRMACELIRLWTAAGLTVSLYTNRKMLLAQTVNVMERFGIEHGVRASGHHEDHHRQVQVSSIQTENARVFVNRTWKLHTADRVIVDEAHLNCSGVAAKILNEHHAAGAAYVGLTATPIDLAHLYDTLIVAGTNSELRKTGSLVPAYHYGPDEPDTKDMKRQATGEYSEGQVRKKIMTSTIFARVNTEWQKLNPATLPTILFAPGVAESIWFAEQFALIGVRAAHIDGKNCWLDGQLYPTGQQIKQDIMEGSKDGSIKVVCNRYVLREGIDAPWLCHGIMATIMGGLGTWLQSAGRLLRAYPGKDRCTIQDHGGHWHRHGSVNIDRQWDMGLSAGHLASMREERMMQKKEAEPMLCPQCHMVRAGGPKCPGCGFEHTKKSRPVIQLDGTLKEHTGDIYKDHRRAYKSDTHKRWEQCYYRCRNSNQTFSQAEALFFRESCERKEYYWPPRDLPLMPANDADWFKKVKDVPRERLLG